VSPEIAAKREKVEQVLRGVLLDGRDERSTSKEEARDCAPSLTPANGMGIDDSNEKFPTKSEVSVTERARKSSFGIYRNMLY